MAIQRTWQKLKLNPGLWQRYHTREKVLRAIRVFFHNEKFHEVEVPLLSPTLPAESYVEIFETKLLNRQRKPHRAFLTTSPELFLKKLLAAGVGDCMALTKSFRNTEDQSRAHNPEFTILEWYRVHKDYRKIMEDVELLLTTVFRSVYRQKAKGRMLLSYQGQQFDLTPPWTRISMSAAFSRFAQVRLESILDLSSIRSVAQKKGYSIKENNTWEELFHQIYLNEVEPKFPKDKPLIIYDYPVQLAALAAKKKSDDPRFAERFEVYIAGIELADCCTELAEWKEQELRFKEEEKRRDIMGKTEYPVDYEFIEALKGGFPPCAGIALGVDRLVMLFADVPRIQDTLLFPAEELWNMT